MPVHDEAVDFLRLVSEAESFNRSQGYEALKFANGDQWPNYAIQSRGMERPQLTINETDAYCRQVENQQRQQRPRINVHATNLLADPKVAKVLKGICRHIEVNSNGDVAYDTAFSFAIRMGWGYFRLYRDYIREDSNDQDIFIGTIENPFTVYFDPNSTMLDGSDAERCLITDLMTKKAFEKQYPGAALQGFQARATGDSETTWVSKEDIRVAEYYRVEKTRDKLLTLTDGTTIWASQMKKFESVLARFGIGVKSDRESYRKEIRWSKVTAFDTLEEKTIPGRWIPVIPVYGRHMVVNGRRERWGLVRDAMDPARMNNFWFTSMTESIALAPKAKWLVEEGQDEGYENEFAQANLSAKAIIHWKRTNLDGQPGEKPERIQPEPPPEGALAALMQSSQALQRVLGIVDPAQKISGNVSGKALMGEQQKSDNSVFNYYDNLCTSIRQAGRVILSWAPVVYDTERVMRIIGDDGQPDLVTVNERKQDEQGVEKILNDVTVGDYDVVMDTGPGYNSKRQETLAAMTELLQGPLGEIIAPVASDLIVRLFEAPGMDVLADRLAANNPMAQIDKNSDIPPQAQMMIKKLQDQAQKMQQAMQQMQMEMKYRGDLKRIEESAETQREHMRTTVKAHDVEESNKTKRADIASTTATKRHDTETKGTIALKVEEIRGFVDILVKHLEHAQNMESAEGQFDHETEMADKAVTAKENQKEPA